MKCFQNDNQVQLAVFQGQMKDFENKSETTRQKAVDNNKLNIYIYRWMRAYVVG